jgi:hypothetical protein
MTDLRVNIDGTFPLISDREAVKEAVLSRLQPKEPFDFRVPDLPGVIDPHPVVSEVYAAVEKAIRQWAKQSNVTPEEWLKIYKAVPSLDREGNTLHVVVRPALRDEDPQDFIVIPLKLDANLT